MKGFIEKLSKLEGAATVLAAITLGRAIGQVARGFPEDPETKAQVSLYLALAKLYPHGMHGQPRRGVVNIPTMFTQMLKNTPDNSSFVKDLNLTPEEQKEWAAQMGMSERDKLNAAARPFADLCKAEAPTATLKAWYDLTPLAQHSLAVRTERNLAQAINRYTSWTSEDGAMLLEIATSSAEPLAELVSEITENYRDELDQARANGINVATRIDRRAAA
jgi:hypothetical protein